MNEHRDLTEWVSYNEQMCQLIRRIGAPATIEMAQTWLDTIGRWAEKSAGEPYPEEAT